MYKYLIPFLYLNNISMCEYTTFCLFIHKLIYIWIVSTLGLLWSVMLWTFVYRFLCGCMFSVLLDIYLGVELLSHMVTLFTFWGTAKVLSRVPVPFYIPPSTVWGFLYLYILANICFVSLFDYSHPGSCEVISHCGFDLHFCND